LFVVLFACCFTDGTGSFIGLLHFLAFGVNIAAFVVGLTSPFYTDGCATSNFEGCQILRAAIGMAGVLM
jgi:hypothetical protein